MVTTPVPVPLLSGHHCRFVFLDHDDDARPRMIGAARSFLDAGADAVRDLEPYVYRYCRDVLTSLDESERPIEVPHRAELFGHVRFGEEIVVRARFDGDAEDGVYLSLGCECDWEPEHGLMLVFRDGPIVAKVGPYDGHVTNADAFANRDLVGVVYWSPYGEDPDETP